MAKQLKRDYSRIECCKRHGAHDNLGDKCITFKISMKFMDYIISVNSCDELYRAVSMKS